MVLKSASFSRAVPLIYALFSLLALLYIVQCKVTDGLSLSIIYVLIQCLGIVLIWHVSNRKLGVFIMFQLTFSLFIGGRFWAYLLNPAIDLEIFEPTFFFDYNVSADRKIDIYSYVVLFIIFSILGYCLGRKRKKWGRMFNVSINKCSILRISQIANWLFPIFAIYTLYSTTETLIQVINGGGYLMLYSAQTEEYVIGASIVKNLVLFFFAYSFAYGNKMLQNKYLVLYLINAVLSLMMGTRSAIGAIFLFCIWLYSLQHKINLLKLFGSVFVAMIILLFLFSFSVRASEEGNSSFSLDTLQAAVSLFFYSQGISLMVFDVSRLIDDYPLVGYLQVFLPGTSALWKMIGYNLPLTDLSFSHHMCYELNPDLFLRGNGLGWSILSTLYLFSFQSVFLFIILSLFLGCLFGFVEALSERYTLYKYLSIYIFMTCMLLPRAAGLINILIYGIVFLVAFRFLVSSRYSS